MIKVRSGWRLNLVAASAMFFGVLGSSVCAEAAAHHASHKAHPRSPHHTVAYRHHTHHHGAAVHRTAWRVRRGGTWLQCVPYARRVSGIELRGNANTWWREADGRYERGQSPEEGAVLSFRANRHMSLGHVAVVAKAVNAREILINQANWPMPGQRYGNVSKAVSVIDVSPNNDWTAVRVELGHSGRYGSVYATNGFIYGHSTADNLMADELTTAPKTAPSGTSAGWSESVQLASAPGDGGPAIADSAPDRNLR
ncbi:MAG TPA: CHAP domain-containing protein [Acidisoma sp.]|jgi:surface antigen|nr:CHAP domain-containing protein [Acidisoma sp.]